MIILFPIVAVHPGEVFPCHIHMEGASRIKRGQNPYDKGRVCRLQHFVTLIKRSVIVQCDVVQNLLPFSDLPIRQVTEIVLKIKGIQMGLFDIFSDLVTDLIFEIIIELFQFIPIICLCELALGDFFIELFEEVFPFLLAPVFKGCPRFSANSFLDPRIENLYPLRRDDVTIG